MSKKTCPKCANGPFPPMSVGAVMSKHVATTPVPSIATMERWSNDGVARATDGCRVEPDGRCSHNHQSWLMRLGYI